MNVGELFHSVPRDKVLDFVPAQYCEKPEERDNYERAWITIVGLQPQLTTMVCVLSKEPSEEEPPAVWVDISGRRAGEDEYYALEFMSWPEWLAMEIELDEALSGLPEHEILGHILYEMTYAGYDQGEIQQRFDHILDAKEEAEARFLNPPPILPS